jgi:transcriptional regulator with XRE-family HTH domain
MNAQQIGQRLSDERHFRKWTQDRVVEELDFPSRMTVTTVRHAERPEGSRSSASLRIIMALLDLYGLELAIVRKGTHAEETEAGQASRT